MTGHLIALGCLLVTVGLYALAKQVYQARHSWWSAPLLAVPVLLVSLVLLARIPLHVYFKYTHWLTWMLGPATVAFAVPIYQNRAIMLKHWFSLSCGVLVSMPLAIISSVGLARLLGLSAQLQRSLASRSISTPFAIITTPLLGGKTDLAVLFVVITGICGILVGELLLSVLPLRSKLARGVLFGAAAHAAGTAKAREIGAEEGVIASLTMMLGGLFTVLTVLLINHWML